MRVILTALLLILLACTVRGQQGDNTKESWKESHRRGEHLEETGSTQAGPETVVTASTSLPEDDSDRWWINSLMTDDPRYKARCERLEAAWSTEIELQAWADPADPGNSWAHLKFRDVKSPMERDWVAKIEPAIAGKEFPIIHLQPPVNGSFGQNHVTVGMIFYSAWNGDTKKLSALIRAKIKTYADTIAKKRFAVSEPRPRNDGHGQFQSSGERLSVPVADHRHSRNPTEWPDLQPAAPPTLSLKDIMATCPQADARFLRDQLGKQLTNKEVLEVNYLAWLEEKEAAKPKPPAARPKVEIDPPTKQPPSVVHDDSAYDEADEAKSDPTNPTWEASSLDVLVIIAIAIALMIGVPKIQRCLKARRSAQ